MLQTQEFGDFTDGVEKSCPLKTYEGVASIIRNTRG